MAISQIDGGRDATVALSEESRQGGGRVTIPLVDHSGNALVYSDTEFVPGELLPADTVLRRIYLIAAKGLASGKTLTLGLFKRNGNDGSFSGNLFVTTGSANVITDAMFGGTTPVYELPLSSMIVNAGLDENDETNPLGLRYWEKLSGVFGGLSAAASSHGVKDAKMVLIFSSHNTAEQTIATEAETAP